MKYFQFKTSTVYIQAKNIGDAVKAFHKNERELIDTFITELKNKPQNKLVAKASQLLQ